MSEVFKIDKDFELGMGDGAYRLGSRMLVTALLAALKTLRDSSGKTPELSLRVDLVLQVVDEPEPFARVETSYHLGRDKASSRLGLRDMVEGIRNALDVRIAEHGDQHPLVMHTLAVLEVTPPQ